MAEVDTNLLLTTGSSSQASKDSYRKDEKLTVTNHKTHQKNNIKENFKEQLLATDSERCNRFDLFGVEQKIYLLEEISEKLKIWIEIKQVFYFF